MGLFLHDTATMKLFVRAQDQHLVEVAPTSTVGDVKASVEAVEGIAASEQSITFAGCVLSDDDVLSAVGVSEMTTLDITVGLLGGKQHGSLTQAGRVKGRTPKVEKATDKKKPKTGRCKRRLQYNKRFINAVVGFGGKAKGPNSRS